VTHEEREDDTTHVLDDGEYDAVVLDGDALNRDEIRLELTIAAGPHKGEVVRVRATGLGGDPIGLLGLPARLTVTNGRPHVVIER